MKDRATDYARAVVRGEVVAGLPHIQACKRHLSDISRQDTRDFPYIWQPEKSERILDYAETLTLAEGTAPTPLRLHGFQAFDLGVPMGWIKTANGARRFRRSYESMGRQNGKSLKNGVRGTYIAAFGGYHHGKIFTAATKKRQSRIAWEEMEKFIQIDPDLRDLFKVQGYKSLITSLTTNCTIEALSREGGLDEGFRAIYVSLDEIHQQKDNSVYKALYNGTKALKETLVSMITTRGKSMNSFCFEMDEYCLNILNGSVTAEDFFVDIYTLDKDDNIFDEACWIKANPFLARTESGLESLRVDAETARNMGGMDLTDFKIKSLNLWAYDADKKYLDPEKWVACGTDKTLADMRGRKCYVGLDLSSGGDLTTLSLEFPLDNGGAYLYSHSFMPRGRFEEHIKTDLAPYDIWEKSGLITITGGESDYKNDYKFIIRHLGDIKTEYDLEYLGIAYDPHNADGILADLETFGCDLLLVQQSAKFLNDATVDFQLNVKSGLVEYDRQNELLTWSMINASVVKNSFAEIKVDKEPRARHRRIDPVDACIDAHVMAMTTAKETTSAYETRGMRSLL